MRWTDRIVRVISGLQQREQGSLCWMLRCPANTVRCMCHGPATRTHTLSHTRTHTSIQTFTQVAHIWNKHISLGFICTNMHKLRIKSFSPKENILNCGFVDTQGTICLVPIQLNSLTAECSGEWWEEFSSTTTAWLFKCFCRFSFAYIRIYIHTGLTHASACQRTHTNTRTQTHTHNQQVWGGSSLKITGGTSSSVFSETSSWNTTADFMADQSETHKQTYLLCLKACGQAEVPHSNALRAHMTKKQCVENIPGNSVLNRPWTKSICRSAL